MSSQHVIDLWLLLINSQAHFAHRSITSDDEAHTWHPCDAYHFQEGGGSQCYFSREYIAATCHI